MPMRRRIKYLLLAAAVAILLPVTVYAMDNEYFTLTVPESYKEEQKDELYLYTKDDEIHNFAIAVSEHPGNMGSIKKITDEEIQKYEDARLEEYASGYGDSVTVLKRGPSKFSEYDAILFLVKRNDINYYQSMYMFWSDHYLYNICITADKEDFFYSEEYKSIVNSFKIKDTMAKVSRSVLTYTIWGIIAATLAAVLVCLRYALKKDRKQNKNVVN